LAYKITFKKSVAKDLKKIPKQEVENIIKKLETELIYKAETLPMLQGNFAGLRKFRVGNHRVIFTIINDNILILRIQHRKDVYKNY